MDGVVSNRELVRPWRTATIVASAVAALELVLLVGAAGLIVAKPLSHSVRQHAETAAFARTKKARPAVAHKARPAAAPKQEPALSRARTHVMVLNGNGKDGAAAAEAARLKTLGYGVTGAANARRQDYATSVVLYRPGFRAEGLRLARDLRIRVVGPLDGITPSSLQGGQLAVILGA